MYIIEHCYDVDGGFGDAVEVSDVIGVTESKEEAEAYVAKYSHPEIYDRPYSSLYHKELRIREVATIDINKDPFGDGDAHSGYNYQYEEV